MSVTVFLLGVLRDHLLAVVVMLLLVLFLPKLVSFTLQQWRFYSAFKSVPCSPDQHFLLGDAPRLLREREQYPDYYTALATENNWKAFKYNMGPGNNSLAGVHPDVLKIILRSDPKSELDYGPFVPWLGRGLLIANGSKWMKSRKLLTPAFHYKILRPYVGVYKEAAREMVDLWAKIPEGESFDAFPYISLLTLDIMLRCACSHKSDCQVSKCHSPYIEGVYELSRLVVRRSCTFYKTFNLIYFFTSDYWEMRKYCRIVHEFSMDIIKQRRKELQESMKTGVDRPKRIYRDFIDILLQEKDESGVGMTDTEIRAEVDTFMFEGHDTTASGIAWTLYNLALHPEHQEICRREVDEMFDQKDTIDVEDLKSLEYLKYCIKESMRMYPPVVGVGRVLSEPTEIAGYKMPKGTSLSPSIYAVHHHPDFWENPYDFDPLRFTPERSKGRHSHAYVPFSAGPRNCIGQEFAMNEERVVLATILRHFEILLDEAKPVHKEIMIIMRPKDGLYFKLKHREN